MALQESGDARIVGNLFVGGDITPLRERADILAQEPETPYAIDLTNGRVHDAPQTLIGTAGNDDLGLSGTTFGTDSVYVTTGDVKNTTTDRKARYQYTLPPEYEAGETMKLRITAGMLTTVASASADLDVEVYSKDGDRTVTGDLCATAAQSINSLTAADKDFTITATSLVPGMELDIRVSIAIVDSATATAVIGTIISMKPLLDIRG